MKKSTVYGYARVSTMKQKIERQVENIKSIYPNAIVITESYTGTKMDRPEWSKLYSKLQSGDTVIFDEVSRMSRNAEEGFLVYKELYERGVKLIFLKESTLNTENFSKAAQAQLESTGDEIADTYIEATNKVLLLLAERQIKAAFETAQHEVDFLRKRTKEGLARAKLNGQHLGVAAGTKLTTKKSIEAKEIILKHSKLFNGTLSDPDVIKLTGLARNTYYKYKKELIEQAQ